MNVEYINPIIKTSMQIIKEVTNMDTKMGDVYIKQSPYTVDEIAVIIGMTGSISGQATFSASKTLAAKIATAMIDSPGSEISELDEMAKSAFAEMTNMIMGNYLSLLPKKTFVVDITPPVVILAQSINFSLNKQVIVCIPLMFEDGEVLEIHISFVENT